MEGDGAEMAGDDVVRVVGDQAPLLSTALRGPALGEARARAAGLGAAPPVTWRTLPAHSSGVLAISQEIIATRNTVDRRAPSSAASIAVPRRRRDRGAGARPRASSRA